MGQMLCRARGRPGFPEVGRGSGAKAGKTRGTADLELPRVFPSKQRESRNEILAGKDEGGLESVCARKRAAPEILEQFHDRVLAGHPGIDRTRLRVRSLSWWPKLGQDIGGAVRSCATSARKRLLILRAGGYYQTSPIPNFRQEEVSLNLIVGLPVVEEGYDAV